jgi:hypothetical protein
MDESHQAVSDVVTNSLVRYAWQVVPSNSESMTMRCFAGALFAWRKCNAKSTNVTKGSL